MISIPSPTDPNTKFEFASNENGTGVHLQRVHTNVTSVITVINENTTQETITTVKTITRTNEINF